MIAYETRAVLAAARHRTLSDRTRNLTHVILRAGASGKLLRPLCNRVRAEHLADVFATDSNAPATCPICAARDPRARTR